MSPSTHLETPQHQIHALCPLRTRLLLLLLPQRQQTHPGNLDDLKPHTWNITLGLALTTKAREKHFVVLVNKV